MSDERLHRTPEANGAVVRWARAAVRLGADPPLRRPRAPRLEPVRRSWLGAFWQVRIGVRAGMTLDDFLRSRLARYLAGLNVPRERLPLCVDVQDGQLSVRAAPKPAVAVEVAEEEAWLAALVALDGPAVRQEVRELEIRIATLDGELESQRHRSEELAHKLASDVSAGVVTGAPEVNATSEQLGRPAVRSGAPRALALGFAAVTLGAETWQVAQPLLRTAGIEPTLGAEALSRPGELAFASVFALGVATAMFALAHAALGAALGVFRGDTDDRARRGFAIAALAASGLAFALAGAVVALGISTGAARLPTAPFVLLLVAVPLAAALVLRGAQRDREQRDVELAAALAWDREQARALGERARRLDELAWAQEEERDLERQRDAARRRLRDVNARAVSAARIAAEAERLERTALARLAQSLVAALELDRYEFVRQASARGAHELLASQRRSVPSPRPSFDDETTAPVAAAVEAGRLAS